MEPNTRNQQQSAEPPEASSITNSPMPSPAAVILPKLYRSIYQLPLHRFIDCMVDKNLYALVISGNPTLAELEKAWGDIRLEYADKMADFEYKVYLSLFKEINTLKGDIDTIRELINIMKETYTDQFAKKLNKLLITNFTFSPPFTEAYDKLLNRCYNMTGALRLRLDMQISNFKAIEEKHKGNADPTRDYYLSLLITLSDNAGYALPESMTTFEFCERMARAHAKTEQIKKQSNARRKN